MEDMPGTDGIRNVPPRCGHPANGPSIPLPEPSWVRGYASTTFRCQHLTIHWGLVPIIRIYKMEGKGSGHPTLFIRTADCTRGGAKDVDWKRNSPRYRPFRSWYRRLCVSDDPWKLCAGHWHNSNSGMDCNEPPVLALICGLFDTRLRHRSVLANFSTSVMSPPQLPKS